MFVIVLPWLTKRKRLGSDKTLLKISNQHTLEVG